MSENIFYNRLGAVVVPEPGAVVRPRRAIYALLVQSEHVLLIWPNFTNGIPDLPGGGIDPGETPDGALRREWLEETGLAFPETAALRAEYRHTRGFHAEDQGEFWIYDQTFRLYCHEAPVTPWRWRNPEDDVASWEPLAALANLPLNRAHWQAVRNWLPQLGLPRELA